MNSVLTAAPPSADDTPRLADFVRDSAGVWQSPHAAAAEPQADQAERRIHAVVSAVVDNRVYSQELISAIGDWATEYQFSPRRANLLRLLSLDASHRVLELGCDCGALTQGLAETGCEVDAVEASPYRARIAARRVAKAPRAKVHCSDLLALRPDPSYDLVTLIGASAHPSEEGQDPLLDKLRLARRALKPDGTVLLAVENKLGLKYFAGMPEDHSGRAYHGIESRHAPGEAAPLGKLELERKLREAGFGHVSFYFPFPDHKLPEVVIAERALLEDDWRADDLLQGLEYRDYTGQGQAQFQLDMALRNLHEEGLVGSLANAFLVLASCHGPSPLVDPALLAQKYTDTRRPGLNTVTDLLRDGDDIAVITRPINREAVTLKNVSHQLSAGRHRPGRNLYALLRQAARRGDEAELGRWLKLWHASLLAAADEQGLLPGDWVDAIPHKLIVQPDECCAFVERDWRLHDAIAANLPLYRGLLLLAGDDAFNTLLPQGERDAQIQWLCGVADWEFDAQALQAALEANDTLWREAHESGRWWRADRYRLPPQAVVTELRLRPLDYAEVLNRRQPSEARMLDIARNAFPAASVRLAYVIVADQADEAALETTLDNLDALDLPAHAVHVLGKVAIAARFAAQVRHEGDACAEALNRCLACSEADWIQLIGAGDTLSPLFPFLLEEQVTRHPELSVIYADEDTRVDGQPAAPIFKPDLNLDLLRSYPYTGRSLAFRREHGLALGGFAEDPSGIGGADLIFRCIERYGLQSVGHIAEPVLRTALPYVQWLALPSVGERSADVVSGHLARLGLAHAMEPTGIRGVNRVRYLHDRQPPVSIIIPTRDDMPALNGLIDSLFGKTAYRNFELLIVDNDSSDPTACAYLDGIERMNNPQLRVLRWHGPFNNAAINNFAAAQARGEYLVLLNNGTAVLHEDWIDALLNHAQRPEVGVVGAKLHFPDTRIQHAGVVLGLRGVVGHPAIGATADAPGYMQRLQVDQNYTAVTGACLMIRTSVYADVGGMDEQAFALNYGDVDLCIRVHKAGYLNVWTPHARLMNDDGAIPSKLGTRSTEEKIALAVSEQQALHRKWLPLLARDPAYNRNLSLDGNGYGLDQSRHQSWQPFEKPLLPRFAVLPADTFGCGHYRMRQPFLAMQDAGIAEGVIATGHAFPLALERFGASSIVMQRQITESQRKAMERYKEFSSAFKVYELDDYLPNLPIKSAHRSEMPRDILKSLRKAVSLCDRFVVSTAPLAEQFADMHTDIRVVQNRLPSSWWGDLAGKRRRSAKPRVGWAGGSSHRGDLELIADVVSALAGEVEWVFFGMCPAKLRPYVHEFHAGVPIEEYPAKLAALDLDLGLAPLEDNVFNACKSNLRQLEYGACGVPVVCSDIVCYRNDLPVTRVRNRFKEWVDAIRMHLADMDACARQGDALRDAIQRDWMLQGENLLEWRRAWLPD